jgi:beta-glucanase (GH16 family)
MLAFISRTLAVALIAVPAAAAPVGQTVWLRAVANGRYVSADVNQGGALLANRTAVSGWETFVVVDAGSPYVALRANANGRYVAADLNQAGALIANRTAIGDWERFEWLSVSGGIALRARANARYVAADLNRGANAPLVADRTGVSAWETFAWGASSSPTPTPAPTAAPGWRLVWADEFNAAAGTGIDSTKWKHDVGGGGWGNNELETYTNRTSNASHNGSGSLVITARRETFTGIDGITRNYTSARILTAGKFTPTYGRIESRMRIPIGQGIWPAFWMLGNDIGTVNWPTCGEIDIMENVGSSPSTVHGTLHGPGYSGASPMTATYSLPSGQRFADAFHVFTVEWEPNVIRWYVDGNLYQTRTPSSLPSGTRWVFDHPFFMILNVAVGGNWPGPPNASTVFPQTMTIDYVRVYQR